MRNRRTGALRISTRAGTLLLLAVATACGNLTPGGIGEATVAVTGNVPAPVPSSPAGVGAIREPSSTPSLDEDEDEADEAEGEVHVRFLVSLVTETGSQIGLGDGEIEVEVDLQGANEMEAVREVIPTGRYTELRLVFTEISAELDPGSLINGQPIVGGIDVELEDVSLLVTRPLDLDVGDGDSVLLRIDLNAPAWLNAVDPVLLTVDESVFAGLINVVIP